MKLNATSLSIPKAVGGSLMDSVRSRLSKSPRKRMADDKSAKSPVSGAASTSKKMAFSNINDHSYLDISTNISPGAFNNSAFSKKPPKSPA